MSMMNFSLEKIAFTIIGLLVLSVSASSCKKDNGVAPGVDTGIHNVDTKFIGKWMWTESSDGAYYDDNGVYTGSAYGFAMQYKINADGSGTCFNHIYSSLGAGSSLEVNISYKGFFESDNQGHLGFFPTSGTYKSSSGENRTLRQDELWNTKTNSGRSFVYQQVTFTSQGDRQCFQVTSSNGVVDTFFKQP